MTNTNYTSGSIKVLEGLDAVRMRPGMYIGSTGSRGLHHMLWEIVDNAVDEAANGFADLVTVTINPDSSVRVTDNGRGVPVDKHPQLKVSGVEVVYTQLHAGGKFDNDSYSYSGGLHGVGASVVNALSEWMSVEVHRDGKIYRQQYESVFSKSKNKVLPGRPKSPLEECGKTFEHGTIVTFKPDIKVFDHINFNPETIERRLRELAFLNSGLTIDFKDLRKDPAVEVEYCFKGGISDYVKLLNEEKTTLHAKPIVLTENKGDLQITVCFQYTTGYTENIFSFVNNIPTTEGGTHETGLKSGLTKVMNEYLKKSGLIKGNKAPNITGEDFREGITCIISLKMRGVQFEGQTKSKLGNTDARTAVDAMITKNLTAWMSDLKNQKTANAIMEKALKSAKVRNAARKAKQMARKRSSLEGAPLVGKLSSCTGRKAEDNELIIVEGDSAGGSAKQGRDRRFQAILPLRGKPLNAERKRLDAVIGNEEFRSIITAINTGIDVDFNIDNLKYHKIIILSDADQDGAHIRAILLTFFFRYMRELIQEGKVYIGLPPLYRVKRGRFSKYCYDERDLKAAVEEAGRGYTIQRYKGLGEMNPEQLWETTLNPDGRKLLQVTIDDAAAADAIVTTLMGNNVEKRREYIINHANFSAGEEIDGIEAEGGVA